MRTLLLADDSVTIQRVIALTFANEDFRVISVSDGQQAIDRMTAQRPDIILAGTTMPNLNGYDVSQFVRSQPGLMAVPVLLLTGAFESVDDERLVACGANGIIEKPFEPTIVISRVKELLGLKAKPTPAPASGRLVTSADSSAAKRPPRPPVATPKPPVRAAAFPPIIASPAKTLPEPGKTPSELAKMTPEPAKPLPTSWEELRQEGGLDASTRSVEGSEHEAGRTDYLDSLDEAFDTLDAKLSTRPGGDVPAPKNTRDPGTANVVFEADPEWFAADDKSRAANLSEQRQLAAEMGVHDLDLPEAQPGLHPAPAADLDFDFGLDEVQPKEAPIDVHDEMASLMPPPTGSAPPVAIPPIEDSRESAPLAVEPGTPPLPVADAFVALLVHEQSELHHPAVHEAPAPVIVHTPPPEITDAMLDQIAARVADRLNGSLFADHLRAVIAATVRDTVRSVVSESSEKLVRDEIARVKAQAERDTQ